MARVTPTRSASRATLAQSSATGPASACWTRCGYGTPVTAACRRPMTGRARTRAGVGERRWRGWGKATGPRRASSLVSLDVGPPLARPVRASKSYLENLDSLRRVHLEPGIGSLARAGLDGARRGSGQRHARRWALSSGLGRSEGVLDFGARPASLIRVLPLSGRDPISAQAECWARGRLRLFRPTGVG
jgi:hypothetical protein